MDELLLSIFIFYLKARYWLSIGNRL